MASHVLVVLGMQNPKVKSKGADEVVAEVMAFNHAKLGTS